jgi:aminoglycoside 3-N-acetyltransferase
MSSISPEEITNALHAVGLYAGDVALVHSDAIVAAQLPPMPDDHRLDLLLGAIESAIGANGTLVMPAFSYSFTRGEPFDVLNSPSTVGMLTERFRIRTGVCRSSDPIFSFSANGPQAQSLCAIPAQECFGKNSFFAALHKLNCHIVCLGCSLSSGGTFTHYVEKSHGVDYRYDKTFHGITIAADRREGPSSVVYHVRDLTRKSDADLRRLYARLENLDRLRSHVVGRIRIFAVRAVDFFDTAFQMLDEDPLSLIKEGALSV